MKNRKLVSALGAIVAVVVPAASIMAFETPKLFQSGDVISASDMNGNFEAVAAELTALRTELEEVKAKQSVGEVVELAPLSSSRVAAIYQVPADGFIMATPDGTGFEEITTIVRVGNGVDSASVTVNCDGQLCPFNRQRTGDATVAFVKEGAYVMVRLLGQTSGTISLSWFSIRGSNEIPTLIKEE